MRKQGTVVSWDRERAFGFIRSPQTPAAVFFHTRDFSGHNPPAEGMEVSFEEIHVGGKGPRALSVEPVRNAIASPLDATPLPMAAEAEILPKAKPALRSRT
ncbi:MAG: cold shock domain-containing protein, partial [Rubrivivax sp.]